MLNPLSSAATAIQTGIDVEIFDYQQLLDAGDGGVAFTLNLSNPDEDVRYEVRGRAGIQD